MVNVSEGGCDADEPALAMATEVVSQEVVRLAAVAERVRVDVVAGADMADVDGIGGFTVTKLGAEAGTGCADSVVVLRAGAKAAGSITVGFNGQIPVMRNALWIVLGVNAFWRARE